MKDLSVIMPYCNEWPQIAFTIRSIAEELINVCDFEIIAVDNYPEDGLPQKPDRAHYHQDKKNQPCTSHIESMARKNSWLKYRYYGRKLSHWNAKNVGVYNSDGRILLFVDAHVVPGSNSLGHAYRYYDGNSDVLDGTLHLPLTYHILETQKLIYKMFAIPDEGVWHYKFKTLQGSFTCPFEVPSMSTCGMMMTRELFNQIGGWPDALGIYGGGENFINYTLAVMGKKKWIYPSGVLHHHGEQRGYSWNYDDYHRNRMIALYCHGGEEVVTKYVDSNQYKVSQSKKLRVVRDIMTACEGSRRQIVSHQKIDLMDWYESWKDKPHGVWR